MTRALIIVCRDEYVSPLTGELLDEVLAPAVEDDEVRGFVFGKVPISWSRWHEGRAGMRSGIVLDCRGESSTLETLVLWIANAGGGIMESTSDELLAALPDTFRYAEALDRISERQLRRLVDTGQIAMMSRGLYRKSDWHGDEDLIEIAAKSRRATICLRSALARHDLIDDIPAEIDIAIPRGSWTPVTRAPVRWRHFDSGTFDIGRELIDIEGDRSIGFYSAERSIIDAFRLRHLEGPDLANEALKRWLRRGGQPSELLAMARSFPRTLNALRETLEILL